MASAAIELVELSDDDEKQGVEVTFCKRPALACVRPGSPPASTAAVPCIDLEEEDEASPAPERSRAARATSAHPTPAKPAELVEVCSSSSSDESSDCVVEGSAPPQPAGRSKRAAGRQLAPRPVSRGGPPAPPTARARPGSSGRASSPAPSSSSGGAPSPVPAPADPAPQPPPKRPRQQSPPAAAGPSCPGAGARSRPPSGPVRWGYEPVPLQTVLERDGSMYLDVQFLPPKNHELQEDHRRMHRPRPDGHQLVLVPEDRKEDERFVTAIQRFVRSKQERDRSRAKVEVGRITDPEDPAFEDSSGGGFGLFCRPGSGGIRRGTVLLEYAGEVINVHKEKPRMPPGKQGAEDLDRAIAHYEELVRQRFDTNLCEPVYADGSQKYVIRAWRLRNEASVVNCCRGRALDPDAEEEPAREENVRFVQVLVDGWPRVFVVATENIAEAEQLLNDYGNPYWVDMQEMKETLENYRQARRDIDKSRQEAEAQRQEAEAQRRRAEEAERKYEELLRQLQSSRGGAPALAAPAPTAGASSAPAYTAHAYARNC
eukprot:tig00000093_g3507.t1